MPAISDPHGPGELLVKFSAEASRQQREQVLEALARQHQELRGRSGVTLLRLKEHLEPQRALFHLQQLEATVEWAEPNYLVKRSASKVTPITPDDPYFSQQWALAHAGKKGTVMGSDIGALAGWARTIGSRNTIIAVIDTGIELTHPDLKRNLWANQAEQAGEAG